jgi:hypothetical protein
LKKITLMILLSVMLIGCSHKVTEEEFVSSSSEFYMQMFMDGEQSEDVNKLYKSYVDEYKVFADDDLYKTLTAMYDGLNTGSATEHQVAAMKMLNER